MGNADKAFESLPPPELSEIISSIWSFKLYIFAICFVCAVISFFVAINTPNTYRAETLLAPTQLLQGQSSQMDSQLGGLASLAGLGDLTDDDFKTEVAQAKMLTKEFVYAFIKKYDLVAPLIAAKSWNKEEQSFTYDSEIYDTNNASFLLPEDTNPYWLAFKEFESNLLIDTEKNGLVRISYEHISPVLAQQIVTNLVKDINAQMQSYDIEQADKSIHYLNEKLTQTRIADMEAVFYRLIEEQTKTKMLTEIKSEYIFTTLDPAIIPEEKAGPKRAFIIIVSIFLGGILGSFIALIRFYKAR
ncbi:Wzz/FepE/Etk N-terminal domain-containing protein [Pseudoalteromonas atlantica]|uniref:Wzz/FepE/Etk N-terminal domain-containing protein n=1 Tax=Pseudoalteromonas atlantica TaxID=288 RepID=UPI003A986BC5